MRWKPPDPGLSASTAASDASTNRCCLKGKFTFGLKARHCFDHLEACLNPGCQHRCRLLLVSFDSHEATIVNSAVDALLQEVGNAVQLRSSSAYELPSCSGGRHDVSDFVMKARACPKLDMAYVVDVAEIMGQAQEGSSALHGLFLVR